MPVRIGALTWEEAVEEAERAAPGMSEAELVAVLDVLVAPLAAAALGFLYRINARVSLPPAAGEVRTDRLERENEALRESVRMLMAERDALRAAV